MFGWGHRLSNHKTTKYAGNFFGGMAPFALPDYAYEPAYKLTESARPRLMNFLLSIKNYLVSKLAC